MNYHSLVPNKYKRSVVIGVVYRIFYACSTWLNFHTSLQKTKDILRNNQYLESFYDPIIKRTINKLIEPIDKPSKEEKDDEKKLKTIFIQYRGKLTEKFVSSLNKIQAPCKMILTIRKTKSVLPSLKTTVEKSLKSGIVYKITCPRCSSCYVGQTTRHLLSRIREHKRTNTPVGNHFEGCDQELSMDNVSIIA